MVITCSILSYNLIPLRGLPVFLRPCGSAGFLFSSTDEAGYVTQWSAQSCPKTDAAIWSLELDAPAFLRSGCGSFPTIRVDFNLRYSSHQHIQIIFHEVGYSVAQKETPIEPQHRAGGLTYDNLPSPFNSPERGAEGTPLPSPTHAPHDGAQIYPPVKHRFVGPRRSRRLMEKQGTYIHLSE